MASADGKAGGRAGYVIRRMWGASMIGNTTPRTRISTHPSEATSCACCSDSCSPAR